MQSSALKDALVGALVGFVLSSAAVVSVSFASLAVYALTRTPGVDDCMIAYARKLNEGTASRATVYVLPSGNTHVDTEENPSLPVIGVAYGCRNVQPGRPVDSLANTAYCEVARITTSFDKEPVSIKNGDDDWKTEEFQRWCYDKWSKTYEENVPYHLLDLMHMECDIGSTGVSSDNYKSEYLNSLKK